MLNIVRSLIDEIEFVKHVRGFEAERNGEYNGGAVKITLLGRIFM